MKKDTLRKLWEKLLAEACDEAAAGLLGDLFRFLQFAEAKIPALEPIVDPKAIAYLRDLREAQRTYYREVLMELLEDEDGAELKNWYQLFCDDPAAFRQRARQFTRDRNDAHENGLWQDGSERSSG